MTAGIWFSLASRNRFAFAPQRIPMAVAISCASLVNSFLRCVSEAVYRRRAESVELGEPPIFVIGHWRTGTTLLHELLVQDERFSYPTTFQCMAPHHFLMTTRVLGPLIDKLMPRKRPMDNMPVGYTRPQEDEFALVNLGAGSNYLDWAFPNRDEDYDRFLTLEGLTEAELDHWRETFLWFLRRLAVYDARRLVLKSPTHTARIKTILELFPGARFVHIVRDPRSVLPSTVRTWTRLTDALSFQIREAEFSLEGRLAVFNKMYRSFHRDRSLIPDGHLYEVRFEDLMEDPLGELGRIYAQLELGDFETARSKVQEYLDGTKGFQGNKHDLPDGMREQIYAGCQEYVEQYGYTDDPLEKQIYGASRQEV